MPLGRRGPGLVGMAARTVTEPLQYEAPAPPAAPDYATEIEQLAQLKAQGILTEDEFQAKKKQILGI